MRPPSRGRPRRARPREGGADGAFGGDTDGISAASLEYTRCA